MAQYINWYKIIKIADFEANQTPSMDITMITDAYGEITVGVFKSNYYALSYKDIYLPIGLNGQNPYKKADLLAYKDDIYLWLGIIENDQN